MGGASVGINLGHVQSDSLYGLMEDVYLTKQDLAQDAIHQEEYLHAM